VHDIVDVKKFDGKSLQCVHCHSNVGHGERTGMGRYEKGEWK
jgi:cytochrome c